MGRRCQLWRNLAGETASVGVVESGGWQFFQRCGDYEKYGDNHKAAFLHFAAVVENMIAKEVGEYLTVFNPSMEENKAHAKKIMDTIVDLVVEKMKEKNTSTEA
jgi:hypothetical protein